MVQLKNCLVAGAGSGIGKSLLREIQFNHKNWNVFGLSRRGLEEKIIISGNNYFCNLTKETDVKSMMQTLSEQIGKLNAIYITLGSGLFRPIGEITSDEWDEHLNTNLKSAFLICKYAEDLLERGAFVCFLSSTAGKMGFSHSSAYCASKHAITGFAKAMREEWKEKGIRVFMVYPGAIYTDIWKDRAEFSPNDMMNLEGFSAVLSSFLDVHPSINIDESYILPPKGIL